MENAVDHRAEHLISGLHHNDKTVLVLTLTEMQDLFQADKRKKLVTQPQYRRIFDTLDAVITTVAGAHEFKNRKLRDGEALAAGFDNQRRHDCERQRDFNGEACSGAGNRLQIRRAADLLDIAADHVHTDATTGNAGDLRRRLEARHEDEIADFRL